MTVDRARYLWDSVGIRAVELRNERVHERGCLHARREIARGEDLHGAIALQLAVRAQCRAAVEQFFEGHQLERAL